MKPLIIPIHSFIDLITNSSSETFISVNEGTVSAVKQLVNNILESGNSEKTCDDLFTIAIDFHVLVITPKVNTAESEQVARVMSNITSLFDISSKYNG